MAGYADALASVLYPNTAANSAYTLFGQGVRGISLPTFEKPWQNAIAQGLQGLLGAGLQTYGAHSAAQANAENAAKMVPYLQRLGVGVSPEIQSGLTSSDPGMQRLALALTETQMNQTGNAAAAKADMEKFRQQKQIELENSMQLERLKQQGDIDRAAVEGGKLRELPPSEAGKINNSRSFADMATELKSLAEQMDETKAGRLYKQNLSTDSPEYKFYSLLDAAQQRFAGAEQSGVLTDQDRAIYSGLFKGKPVLDSKQTILDRLQSIVNRGEKSYSTMLDTYKKAKFDVTPFEQTLQQQQERRAVEEKQRLEQERALMDQAGGAPGQPTPPPSDPMYDLPPLGPNQVYVPIPGGFARVTRGQ